MLSMQVIASTVRPLYSFVQLTFLYFERLFIYINIAFGTLIFLTLVAQSKPCCQGWSCSHGKCIVLHIACKMISSNRSQLFISLPQMWLRINIRASTFWLCRSLWTSWKGWHECWCSCQNRWSIRAVRIVSEIHCASKSIYFIWISRVFFCQFCKQYISATTECKMWSLWQLSLASSTWFVNRVEISLS